MLLVIGNKNYSSWSLRPWLLMQHFDVAFEEQQIWLFSQEMPQQMRQFSPSLKVPALIDGETSVWDSLAICEYINEQYLAGKAWPSDTKQRAVARAICSEMHSGFNAIRNEMPMNCRREPASIVLSRQAEQEIARVFDLFEQCLSSQTPIADRPQYLFCDFSIADAFFMPLITRFASYAIDIPAPLQAYFNTMLNLPAYQVWLEQATAESAIIEQAEI